MGFTADNAARFGRKGAAALAASLAVNKGIVGSVPSKRTVLARTRTLLRLMGQAQDSKEWDALSRAYERLFKVWQVLAGLPGPGQLRPVGPSSKLPRRRVFELDAEIESQKTLPEGNRNESSFPSSQNTSDPADSA